MTELQFCFVWFGCCYYYWFCFCFGHAKQHAEYCFPTRNPCLLQWKCGVLKPADCQGIPKSCFESLSFGVISYCCCSVAQSCLTLCDPMDCSMPGFPILHHLPELAQTHVHWVGDVTQPSHPLSSPSPAFNLSQHQDLFRWVSSSHQVAQVLEFQLQHQSF